MSSFAVLLLCVHACLLQYTFANTIASSPSCGGYAPKLPSILPVVAISDIGCEPYEGFGVGNVKVSGDVGIKGTTRLTGTVPVLGSVKFQGQVPAHGKVSISGKCGCGCH